MDTDSGSGDGVPILVLKEEFPQDDAEDAVAQRVPLTIVSGYLGSGKTTLVNYILREQHGKKIAVILNEFGDSADIEKALTISQNGEQVQEWLELANGCICCSIKDTGLASIESLVTTRGGFDYILLETSGLADPGNLAPLFWTDEGLGSNIYLDGIVTLVDAKNILTSLDETSEEEHEADEEEHAGTHLTTAHLQISHADVIVINKADAVTPAQLEAAVARIKSINGLAKVHITQYSQVPQLESFLLDLHAYDGVQSLEDVEKGHSHIDPTISTISLPLPLLSPSQFAALESWLRLLLWEDTLLPPLPSLSTDLQQTSLNSTTINPNPIPPQIENDTETSFSIHRTKGLIHLHDGTTKMLQGVREVFEITDLDEGKRASSGDVEGGRMGKLVFIGRGLKREKMEGSLARALREVGD